MGSQGDTVDDIPVVRNAALERERGVDADDRYHLGEEVGRGSMGRVCRGYDARLARPVAVKELIACSPVQRARFAREARIAARLQHPGIVPIYDLGTLQGGEPFYCMKLVSGRSLERAIDAAATPADRLGLVANVLAATEALAYAHSQHIIHRDLKPLNVLLGEFGETMVIDWGLAKDLDAREPQDREDRDPGLSMAGESRPPLTARGAILGTPAYMPPEQAAARPVDERADVYALGAILYHVLAGRPPYQGTDSHGVLLELLAGPPAPLRALPGLPVDLVAIVEKAMAREPSARYPTARAMAEDLRRFTTGQLVSAHRYSPLTLAGRWLRRHRGAVTVGLVLLSALAATAVVSVGRVVAARDRAERARVALERRESDLVLLQAQGMVERDPTAALAWLKRHLPAGGEKDAARLVADDAVARGVARQVFTLGADPAAMTFTGDGDRLVVATSDGDVAQWHLPSGRRRTLGRAGDPPVLASVVAGQSSIVTHDARGTVRLWDGKTGAGRALATGDRALAGVAVSPDGRRLATGSNDGTVRLWDLAPPGESRVVARHRRRARVLAFSPDGRALISTSSDGAVHVHDVARGHGQFRPGHEREVLAIGFLGSGAFVTTSEDRTVRLWANSAGARAGRIVGRHEDWIPGLAIAPDGARFVTSSGDRTVRLWDATGAGRVLGRHEAMVYRVAFLPDGTVASASSDGTLRLWDAESGDARVLLGGGAAAKLLAVSNDGRRIAGTFGRQVRIWERVPPRARVRRGHQGGVLTAAWSPGGDRFLTGGRDHAVLLWDAAGGPPRLLGRHKEWVTDVAFLGERPLSGGVDETIQLWDAAGGLRRLAGKGWKQFLPRPSPTGGHVAYLSYDGRAYLVDVGSGSEHELPGQVDVTDLEFFPDGARVATGARDGTVRVWPVAGGPGRLLPGGPGWVHGVAVDPRGRWVAAAGRAAEVWIWDAATGRGESIPAAPGGAYQVSFTRDGRRLVFASVGAAVHVHDLETRRTRVLRGRGARTFNIAHSPDGALIAVASADETVRVCAVATGACARLRGHQGAVRDVAFSPKGDVLLSASEDGTVRLWDLATVRFGPSDGEGLAAWLSSVTTAEIDLAELRRQPR